MKKYLHGFQESVAITLSTNVCLAVACLGVRVATSVVKMMKRKFATSEFQCWLCHSRSARNASAKGLWRAPSFFGMSAFCRRCSCRRVVRFCVVDLESFRARAKKESENYLMRRATESK